ncbi:MFS general substrate transporter [Aspergillus steynii IBT 23096]|uniref:MFS general substrate transporter n=1 Tax=Aspergillus steynii IBT 23096 TaxID=1392250 RepID=A0A2I2FZ21_9EURO|nr:MFS general substrate transporter [Aspergillus steynii IBT 23096]PLB45879.1 MFS general substrate transporter [Aspergillus steynii IBT 23096]
MADSKGEIPTSSKLPAWRMVFDEGAVTQEVINHQYSGSGTEGNPFEVSWIPNDPRNPMDFREPSKWALAALVSISTFTVSLVSSGYSGGLEEIVEYFQVDEEIAVLGISFYVLGFALGPLLLAPMSELYGRRPIFIFSAATLTAFTAGTAGARNMETLVILRFFAGSLGSAPLAVAGGTLADTFPAISRGLASGLYAIAPFMGPTIGPVVGGFLAAAGGWRWVQGFLAILSGAMLLLTAILLPETYSPVLLRKRAKRLSKITGHVYRSKLDVDGGSSHAGQMFKTALSRPFVLLFCEPIVLLMSLYLAIIYGTLYMFFTAYPIVFQQVRGWSESTGGLAFLGILVGILLAGVHTFVTFFQYKKKALAAQGRRLPPEERLPSSFIGSFTLPIGLFWFAWTNSPSTHWMAPIAAGVPFGYGMITVFMAVLNYLIDSYTIYAASVSAANSLLRSIFGAVFPLFTGYMYQRLGIHWASSIPAFLALACLPMPFLFYKYGPKIRERCHYAAEADAFMNRLLAGTGAPPKPEGETQEERTEMETRASVVRGDNDDGGGQTVDVRTETSRVMTAHRTSCDSRMSSLITVNSHASSSS